MLPIKSNGGKWKPMFAAFSLSAITPSPYPIPQSVIGLLRKLQKIQEIE
jgi:hypothetical protein